jgi:hypothetical protein
MYTIELTRGMGWNAPVVEVHSVKPTLHIVDVERRAQGLLNSMRPTSPRERATDYRILDPLGRCVRSSLDAAPSRGLTRQAGRTCWVSA